MPRTSCECSMAAMVALGADDAAFASAARVRSSSLPIPLLAYERWAAGQVMQRRMQRTLERQLLNRRAPERPAIANASVA
eukprot:4737405-Pleurochrysis_carterae.AAC.1